MITIKDIELLEAKIRSALEAHDLTALRALLKFQHPADIADVINSLGHDEAMRVFRLLAPQQAAEVLDETDLDATRDLLRGLTPREAGDILDQMAPDDAAEVLGEDVPERQQALLGEMEPSDAADVRALLGFPRHTAGRLMTDRFARVRPEMTAGETIAYLHRIDPEVLTLDNLYVLDSQGRLVGVVSLREVIMAPPEERLDDIMRTEIVSVRPETDQQEVATLVSHYDLTSIPVADSSGVMLGIVTVDDVIDVFVEEFSEDYLRMAGTDAEEMDRRTPAQVARLRLPWLLGTMVIELFAGLVISNFGDVLKEVILLASFMPVISAVSGNVGLQAAAIVVRGLDTGHVSLARWGKQVGKELSTALLMALSCGLVLGVVGALWSGHLPFGMVIGGALICSMLTAGFMGTVIPMLSKRMGFDPATTAGPFETAFQDVVGFAVFLWLASLLLQWLR